MQEELKEKFILLSKFAKEKKYAQEYLGLLARRGDLGSIRIGKRWHTCQEWFSEFLKDAEKRRAEAAKSLLGNNAVKTNALILETEKEKLPKQKIFTEEKTNISVAGNTKEYGNDYPVLEAPIRIKVPEIAKRQEAFTNRVPNKSVDLLLSEAREIKTCFDFRASDNIKVINAPRLAAEPKGSRACPGVNTNLFFAGHQEIFPSLNKQKKIFRAIPNRVISSPSARGFSRSIDLKPRVRENISEEQFRKAVPKFSGMAVPSGRDFRIRSEESEREKTFLRGVVEDKRLDNVLSPSFAEKKGWSSLFSSKLAFGLTAVLLFFLLFQTAFFFKGDLAKLVGFDQNQGIVAGASDEKGNGVTDVKSEADYYLSNSADTMKESVSFSKLMISTALERNAGQ
jgi:hypothetical protein